MAASCRQGILVVHAQSLPLTKTVTWDANPPSDAVTSYSLWVDTGAVTIVLAPLTTGSVTFTSAGIHVVHATATNIWGTSPEATLTVNILVPSKPTNLRLP